MGIGIMGTGRTGMITYLTHKLSIRGLNIDAGFGARLEEAAGAFFEISGDSIKMEDLFNEIIQERHCPFPTTTMPEQHSPEPLQMSNMIYELKIIAPDRPGIICDISQHLCEERISIDHMVIKTKKRRENPEGPGTGPMGIIYGRLGIPSIEARARFIAGLREAKDGHLWRIKCVKWTPPQHPGDSIPESLTTMN
jgi:glycine cleavage system regulatory protein